MGDINAKTLIFDRCQFRTADILFLGEIEFFRLNSISNEPDTTDVYMDRGNFKHAVIGGLIDKIDISFNDVKGNIQIEKSGSIFNTESSTTSIGAIFLRGTLKDSTVSFRDLKVCRLELYELRNEGNLNFNSISFLKMKGYDSTYFDVQKSHLSKCEFYNMNFKGADYVNINSCHLVDCTFVNIDLNHNRKSITSYSRLRDIGLHPLASYKDLEYYRRNRETLRQLKYAFSKQGDSIVEQQFHELEMLAYYHSLSWRNKGGTKIIIKASQVLSRFGQSVARPIVFLLSVHLILLLIAIATGAFPHLTINPHNDFAIPESAYQYFRLINPIHNINEDFKGWTIVIDVLMRIWSSYMIYNFIRASRRFIK
jgi:hypothetical protein